MNRWWLFEDLCRGRDWFRVNHGGRFYGWQFHLRLTDFRFGLN